ncbi:MAG TPA: preprotein translocase subunit SecG [Flavisolibacter sp.]|jgi:preprotein translocase subunit SecG|nr:preprotein translocase subunit SecG [Flavisolibacter sp.]
MTLLFVILILLACIILSLFILIQNPKGGGLAGNVAGFSSQFMGVKQTNDVLDKGTWIFATVIALLCVMSTVFIPGSHTHKANPGQTQQQSQPRTNPNTGTAPQGGGPTQ